MYKIKSYQGVGDIKFGDESEVIKKIMKTKPRKFKKGPFAINETDNYDFDRFLDDSLSICDFSYGTRGTERYRM